MINNWNFRKSINLAYILIGLTLTVHGELFQSPPELDTTITVDNSTDSNSLYRTNVITNALTAYKEELAADKKDFASLGILAFTLARETGDPRWSNTAIEQLQTVLEKQDKVFLRAYLGSSFALFARDYPYKAFWQIFIGPGLARIYYVIRAKAELNSAVDQAPNDPVVLLLRASTFDGLPSIFGGSEQATKDFSKLRAMIASPPSDYKRILNSQEFQASVLYSDIKRFERLGEEDKAQKTWAKLLQLVSNSPESMVTK